MNIYKFMLTEPGNCSIFVTENNLEIFPSTTLITIVRTANVEIIQTIKTSEHQMQELYKLYKRVRTTNVGIIQTIQTSEQQMQKLYKL